MGKLFERIKLAVKEERFVVSWHADARCEERDVAVWQLVAGIDEAELQRERPASKPHASVVLRHWLADGSEVDAVWVWLPRSRRAQLVTVFFGD